VHDQSRSFIRTRSLISFTEPVNTDLNAEEQVYFKGQTRYFIIWL